MVSVPSFAAELDRQVLEDLALACGWDVEGLPSDPAAAGRREAFKSVWERADSETRDKLQDMLERADRLARDRSKSVLRNAFMPDQIKVFEQLGNDRSRAVWLLLNNERRADLAEQELFYLHQTRRPGWFGYTLDKGFSRQWTPDDLPNDQVKAVVERVVGEVERTRRFVEVEVVERPETPHGWTGPKGYLFLIHVSDRANSVEIWRNARRRFEKQIPNRRIYIMVSPNSKTVDAVAGAGIDREVQDAVVRQFVRDCLDLKTEPVPFVPRRYSLAPLARRPAFETHAEHGIDRIKITKLVTTARPGTATFWAHAKGPDDAYDVASRITGRTSIVADDLLAATIRVEFAARPKNRKKAVTFEITLPFRCTLRGEDALEQIILQQYLPEWGFLAAEPAEDDEAGEAA